MTSIRPLEAGFNIVLEREHTGVVEVQNSVAADIGLFGRAAGHAYAVLGAIRTGGNAHRAYDRQHKRGSDDLFEESFLMVLFFLSFLVFSICTCPADCSQFYKC